MFWSPHLEHESCATASKTVRRIVGRGKADLDNKSFLSVVVKKDAVTGLAAVGEQKKGLAGTKQSTGGWQ